MSYRSLLIPNSFSESHYCNFLPDYHLGPTWAQLAHLASPPCCHKAPLEGLACRQDPGGQDHGQDQGQGQSQGQDHGQDQDQEVDEDMNHDKAEGKAD